MEKVTENKKCVKHCVTINEQIKNMKQKIIKR